MKSQKKKKNQTVKKPSHRDFPTGKLFEIPVSGFGATLFSKRSCELTSHQVNAFWKMLKNKNLRRLIKKQTQPYFSLTKKPSEVRMGKGHGTKISRVINPVVSGSNLYQVKLSSQTKQPNQTTTTVLNFLRKAVKKLPPNYKVVSLDF